MAEFPKSTDITEEIMIKLTAYFLTFLSLISSYAGASLAVPQSSLILMVSVRLNLIACFHIFAAAALSQNSRGDFTLQSGLIFHIWCAGCGRSVKVSSRET